jgi:hypothetical protein
MILGDKPLIFEVVLSQRLDSSGASHCYDAIGDQILCVQFLAGVNLGSHAHYIGIGSGAHYPYIEGIAPIKAWDVDLVPCG